MDNNEDEEDIEYAEGYGEEFGRYQHLDLDAEHLEEESILTEYDSDDFVSCAVTSPNSTFPIDLFDFEHSYGYDCCKYFNLCACDESVVCWASGSMVTFFDVYTKQTWFKRSTTGGTVGAVCSYRQDPNYRIAIAEAKESENEPVIILYFWPQMEIDAVLREGTENAYSILDFSPDGELLASVGKDPDYNLTIWNWKRHKIMLRTSAFTYYVNNVMFSPYCPGQLTTSGAAHIKFWKMVQTFTGLKLKGELGRFGKTEISDVLGIYPMPDEKVLSGCYWGNILVWEAGLVKLEVTQRGRKVCHKAPIIQFMLSEAGDEVTTISQDGCIRAWYWDTVEQADPPEDDQFVELNPVAETCVPDCKIMCLKHQKDMFWYAQDGNGGIWTVDIELDKLECKHTKLMTRHAGPVVAAISMRTHPILVTGGADGAVMAYNNETHMLLVRYVFPAPVSCMLYAPLALDISSRVIIAGFSDGVIRTLLIHPNRIMNIEDMIEVRVHSVLTIHSEDSVNPDVIDLISWLKPHPKQINQITINPQNTLLITCGEDSTIFMYKIMKGSDKAPFSLERLGFIETPQIIRFMTWNPEEERKILLCGDLGLVMEAVLPDTPIRKYNEITTFFINFDSYKDTYIKKQFMRYRPFPTEEDLASIDEEALKAAAEISDKEKDENEEEWLGEIQLIEEEKAPGTPIIWAEYTDEGIWITQRGTGALLLIKSGSNKILKYGPIPGAWNNDLTTLRFICNRRYIIVGTNTGYIRVLRMPTEEEDCADYHYLKWIQDQRRLLKELKGRRLAQEEKQPIPQLDMFDNYYLQMHDTYTGYVTCLEFSVDGKYLFSCGGDGNIFSYVINFEEPFFPQPELPEEPDLLKMEKVKEPSTVDGVIMSHEQLKQKEEYDKMMAIANAHKKRVRNQLAELTIEYNQLIRLNRLLPWSQQIDVTLDPRPLQVQEMELDDAKALTIRKIAHQLEKSDIGLHKMYSRNIVQLDVYPFTLRAIRDPKVMIRPMRQKNLCQVFFDQLQEVHAKMAEAALRSRRTETLSRRVATKKMSWGPPRVASFLLGLPPNPPHSLKKQLRNYYIRLNRHHLQLIEWQEHLSHKPDPNALPPGAAEALKEAEVTIGNHLLKTSPDYVAPPGHNTQLRLCLTRQEIFENKHRFNQKVVELRQQKLALVELTTKIGERLMEIRAEIPPKLVKAPPDVPTIDRELEFPEDNLEVKPKPIVLTVKGPIPAGGKRASMALGAEKKSQLQLLYPQPRIRQPKVARFVPLSESRPLVFTWEVLKPKPDQPSTPLETEIRDRRIERHLFEQDILLKDAEIAVQQFDARLRHLQRERIRVQENNQLLELHLYQLHQEMNVLNRFEAHEDRLAERVYVKLMQVKGIQELIMDCEQRIDEHISEKESLVYQCEEIQRQFKKLVQDYKFADFLRRIFKKKYRAPHARDDDESSESESSSSSSEEDEEGSLDSRDIGPIRLDPNICPEGCDREIYDKTYDMRGTRHKWEQEMQEKDRMVELLKRDIEAHNRIKRKLSIQLDKRKKDLKEFMMEKQNCLNQIDQTVVLRYNQMRARAIAGCTGPEGLSQAVVFPEQLLLKLRKRVLELQDEIKLARLRAKINRTHLFRMNIDLREMKRLAEEIRAQMRDVLTRKLGRPRKVDRTLDDLLRQMARRHKYGINLRILPHILAQFRDWRERHSDLEQKYLKALDNHSERLRLAAALQSNILPQRPQKDPSTMCGTYDIEHYQRDVVRLRIVRSQQNQQIIQLLEEIQELKFKTVEPLPDLPKAPLEPQPSEIWLYMIPPMPYKARHKYFPITPLSSQHKMIYDVNVMKLLYDCLDAMRVTRDDAEALLKDLTDLLPSVTTGEKSRFEVVDGLVRKWLLKHGGDPSQYKKQTRAFDALVTLADRIIRQHMETLEGATDESNKVMGQLEEALKDIAPAAESLAVRIGPTLAALFHTAEFEDLQTEETMTSLVNSLIDADHPLIEQEIYEIDINTVIQNIKDLGVRIPVEEIERIVILSVECLRAQLVPDAEAKLIADEVDQTVETAAQTSAFAVPLDPRVSVSHMDTTRSYQSSRSRFSGGSKTNLEDRKSRVLSIAQQPTLVEDSTHKIGGWGKTAEEATRTTRTEASSKATSTGELASEGSKTRLEAVVRSKTGVAGDGSKTRLETVVRSKTGVASDGSKTRLEAVVGSQTGVAGQGSKIRLEPVVGSKTGFAGEGSKIRLVEPRVGVESSKTRVTQTSSRVITTEQISQLGSVSRTTSRTTTVTEYETTNVDVSGTTDLEPTTTEDEGDSL